MKTVYRCLACGGDIIATTTTDYPDWSAPATTFSIEETTTLDHPGPSDAACRIVLATLRDELEAMMNATLRRVVERMTESFNRRTL